MHVGATLKLLRTSAGLSLNGLATQVGVSAAYISRVEHGHDAPPTPDRLRAIAAVLGLSPDALTNLVDDLRPEAVEWLGHTAAGRHLAAELRRRALSPAQLARVTEFVRREFPLESHSAEIGDLFSKQRILHAVSVPTLRDALDVAAMRLVERPDLERVSTELAAQAHGPTPLCAVGGGLCLAYARASGPLQGCLLILNPPLNVGTPDNIPVRLVLVLAGSNEKDLLDGLVRMAQLASGRWVERLSETTSVDEVLRMLGRTREAV